MLAQRNCLTKATISSICNELAALNLIHEVGHGPNGIGRPGRLLELNAQARSAIGLEISTNYVAVLLTDFCGKVLWRQTTAILLGSPQEVVLEQAEALLNAATAQAKQRALPLLGIGVAVPGWVDSARGVITCSTTLGWTDVALQSLWETRFALPVMVENKARAAAMAEALHGAAQGVKNFVFVSIGTDPGSSVDVAVVVNGIPFRGARGLAVDAGHMILDPNGELCSCGQRGCWRAQADVGREAALVSARLASGESSILQSRSAEELQKHHIILQAALEGDALALDVIRSVATLSHAAGILNLISLFDPELVLIGIADVGRPAELQQRSEALRRIPDLSIQETVRGQMSARGLTPPTICFATHGPDTLMLGAATLLLDAFLRTPPVAEV
jgi:predicted NBD/HSP70 family sugar kinase